MPQLMSSLLCNTALTHQIISKRKSRLINLASAIISLFNSVQAAPTVFLTCMRISDVLRSKMSHLRIDWTWLGLSNSSLTSVGWTLVLFDDHVQKPFFSRSLPDGHTVQLDVSNLSWEKENTPFVLPR